MNEFSKLKIVTLENYLGSIEDSRAGELLLALLRMRALGYGAEYPPGYLCMEGQDFVGTHHMICRPGPDGNWIPLAGFRQVALDCLDFYHQEPSQLTVARQAESPFHVKALESVLESHRRSGKSLIVGSRFVISRECRENKELSSFIKELIAALAYRDHLAHRRATLVGSGVIRFKSHKFLEKLGYLPLSSEGEALSPVHIRSAGSEPTLIMLTDHLSYWAKACFDRHWTYMKERIVIGEPFRMPSADKSPIAA